VGDLTIMKEAAGRKTSALAIVTGLMQCSVHVNSAGP
jgi:hypothetical protein